MIRYIRYSVLLFIFSALELSMAIAQETKITGRIAEASTGDPIPFVNIYFRHVLQKRIYLLEKFRFMKKKILAIDDEKSIRFIIENTFKKDFDVITFANGMDAMFYLQSGNMPDVIICDVEMPVLNGFEFMTIKN